MADYTYDLRRVTHVTAAAVGPPGQRVFYVQAQKGQDLVTLIAEKEYIRALALRIDDILDELERRGVARPNPADEPTPAELLLRPPLEPLFRIGQLSLAYDPDADLMVIEAEEMVLAEPEEEADPLFQAQEQSTQPPQAKLVRFSATRSQMQGLSRNAMDIITTGGRPLCPQCLQPMEASGHLCVKSNGHGNKLAAEL